MTERAAATSIQVSGHGFSRAGTPRYYSRARPTAGEEARKAVSAFSASSAVFLFWIRICSPMTPAQLTRLLQEFLAEARSAVIFENGEEVFAFTEDARSARYSISGDHGKCLLHLWSPERNFVRRITEAEVKKD